MYTYRTVHCFHIFTGQNHMKWKTENVCRIDVGFYISINRYAKNEPNRTKPNQNAMFEQLNISARLFMADVFFWFTHQVLLKFKIKSSKHTYTVHVVVGFVACHCTVTNWRNDLIDGYLYFYTYSKKYNLCVLFFFCFCMAQRKRFFLQMWHLLIYNSIWLSFRKFVISIASHPPPVEWLRFKVAAAVDNDIRNIHIMYFGVLCIVIYFKGQINLRKTKNKW